MEIEQETVTQLINLVRQLYPSWEGFRDTEFEKAEVSYKHTTSQKLRDQLSEEELEQLLQENQYDTIISRIDDIVNDNNLLYVGSYSKGDHNILFADNLDRASFCEAFYDLLYGEGTVHDRLERYLQFVSDQELPSKWTFPTYFLFLRYPETEIMIKPRSMRRFLKLVNADISLHSQPSAATYSAVKDLLFDLMDALSKYNPRDMIDIDSFIYVAQDVKHSAQENKSSLSREQEFRDLFKEFINSPYLESDRGQQHLQAYADSRQEAEQNLEQLLNAQDNGDAIAEEVPRKLFPHRDVEGFRSKGAWVHVASHIGDPAALFKQSNSENELPQASEAVLKFVTDSYENPDKIERHCEELANSQYVKGVQGGTLTPVLHALRPDHFIIANGKTRATINYFTENAFTTAISDYPQLNAAGQHLVAIIDEMKDTLSMPDMPATDLFDTFAHWLVAVKEFFESPDNVTSEGTLAAPLNSIFQSKAEANSVFSLFEYVANKLAVAGAEDPRFSISLTNLSGRPELHFNYGNWLVLGVRGYGTRKPRVQMTLLEQQLSIDEFTSSSRFSTKDDEPEVVIYDIPIDRVIPLDQTLEKAFEQTLDFVRQRLEHYSRTPYRGTNVPELAQAIFDHEWRELVLEKGLEFSDDQHPDSAFTEDTFRLLAELHEHQSKEYYQNHKEEFQEHVEGPFQTLLNAVATDLPTEITNRMETQKGVFARILKNDFGQGGAWDFYWGAFYPKGGKRIRDVQLFMWINRDRLEFGFYIGDYGQEKRERFLNNVRSNQQLIENRLRSLLDDVVRVYGERDDFIGQDDDIDRDSVSVEEWFQNPSPEKIRFAVVLSADHVLSQSFEQLQAQVSDTFKRLYPLVILADEPDPRDAIAEYVGEYEPEHEVQPEYSLIECADQTGFEEEELGRWVRAIKRKNQAILYGPPGTGKTFIADKLARHLVGGGDGFFEVVQFHPSYSYEDFIQGIRPSVDSNGQLSYPLEPGRFLRFCEEARNREGPCVLIIDEINRANLSRVFGELMYLLEYRESEVPLAGGGQYSPFSIPANVLIIGTMNTADRSIALVDHALRRRFAFLPLYPKFDVLRKQYADSDFPIEQLIRLIQRLNAEIGEKHYHIGITYFLNSEDLASELPDIWQMEVKPYLDEYFFDQPEKADAFSWDEVKSQVFQ